uniref:Deleted in malignant brain tumors 1 protein-like n=1 Tax=Oncorhynchus kisutch TaxID=8019 RepID=A0A8C7KFL4_ONCKI
MMGETWLWDMRQVKVVCRELNCGNPVSESRGPLIEDGRGVRLFGGVTMLRCSGDESSIRQCGIRGGPGFCDGEYYHHVTCSESVRLVDGAGLCSGRVEVKSNQSWASVCEADFDRQDAEVVCGEFGCGAPAALQGGLYGEGEGQTWDKEFQCKGNESLLLDCDTSDRENNTCLPGNAVGLTCSEPDDVRLVGGGSRCAGGVEWYDQGEWRTVGADDWDQRDVAVVVCRQLGCGSTVSVLPGNTTRGFGVYCDGSESSLRECRRTYDLRPGLTVICSDLLVQPDIYLTDPMGGVFRGHQGPEMFRGYNFTITCSTQPQYPGGSFLLTFTGSNRTQTQPAVNHSAAFLFPAADDSHQGTYSCVYENYVFSHNFSSESELLSLTITASPLPAFIIRHVVVLLILLTAITTSYLYYKPTRRQKRVNRVSSMDLYVNAMEMVSLSSRAEAGPGEERAAQGTE